MVTLTSVWALAQIIYTPISYYTGNWRLICICVIGVPFLVSLLVAMKLLVETPRYLYSKKRYEDARIILNSIALYNWRPKFNYLLDGEVDLDGFSLKNEFKLLLCESDPHSMKKNYNYFDIFRYPSLRKITFFMFLLWFFRYFTYFGLTFSLSSFGPELHQNFLFTAIGEFLACLLSGIFVFFIYFIFY